MILARQQAGEAEVVAARTHSGEVAPADRERPATGGPGPSEAALVGFLAAAAAVTVLVLVRRGDLRSAALRAREPGLRVLTGAQLLAGAATVWLAWALGGSLGRLVVVGRAGADANGGAAALTLREHGAIALCAYAAGLGAAAALWWATRDRAPGVSARPRWTDAPFGVGALLLALPAVIVTGAVSQWAWVAMGGAPPEGAAHTTLALLFEKGEPIGNVWWWVAVAGAAVGAPLLEELIYRGLLQGAAVRAFGRPWAAIVLTSAVFTVVHLGAAPPYALPTLFVLGVALGVAMERTGRLGVCVAMHAGFNIVNLAAAWLGA